MRHIDPYFLQDCLESDVILKEDFGKLFCAVPQHNTAHGKLCVYMYFLGDTVYMLKLQHTKNYGKYSRKRFYKILTIKLRPDRVKLQSHIHVP